MDLTYVYNDINLNQMSPTLLLENNPNQSHLMLIIRQKYFYRIYFLVSNSIYIRFEQNQDASWSFGGSWRFTRHVQLGGQTWNILEGLRILYLPQDPPKELKHVARGRAVCAPVLGSLPPKPGLRYVRENDIRETDERIMLIFQCTNSEHAIQVQCDQIQF